MTKLPPHILAALERAAKKHNAAEQLQAYGILPSPIESALNQIITQHEDMLRLKVNILKLHELADEILILGETGTGKELIARALHGNRHGQFVGVNITAIPETLLESELFGYVRGAFTDASRDKFGLIKYAEHGTLFLDEIGDMPLQTQAKLLRILQNKTYRRIGAAEEIPVNCRFIFATHRDLKELVTQGKFREDLYFRITPFILRTIPLRERPKDIDLYIEQAKIKLPPEHIEEIKKLPLRGNYRELQHILRRWEVLGEFSI